MQPDKRNHAKIAEMRHNRRLMQMSYRIHGDEEILTVIRVIEQLIAAYTLNQSIAPKSIRETEIKLLRKLH